MRQKQGMCIFRTGDFSCELCSSEHASYAVCQSHGLRAAATYARPAVSSLIEPDSTAQLAISPDGSRGLSHGTMGKINNQRRYPARYFGAPNPGHEGWPVTDRQRAATGGCDPRSAPAPAGGGAARSSRAAPFPSLLCELLLSALTVHHSAPRPAVVSAATAGRRLAPPADLNLLSGRLFRSAELPSGRRSQCPAPIGRGQLGLSSSGTVGDRGRSHHPAAHWMTSAGGFALSSSLCGDASRRSATSPSRLLSLPCLSPTKVS